MSTESSAGVKNVSVLLHSESSRVELASAFNSIPGVEFLLILRPPGAAGPFGRAGSRPEVLLIEVSVDDPTDVNYIRALRTGPSAAQLPIVALVEGANHQTALSAIRAGADDAVLAPIVASDLLEVLSRVTRARRSPESANQGRVVAFVHVSGGAGATTLAVNSAVAIAQQRGTDGVCLLDLDIQYGNSASLLDIQRGSPVDMLVDDPGRLDRETFEGLLIGHGNGVHVLTAPKLPLALGSYRSEVVAKLIELARRRYPVVIVDLPVALAPWTDLVLQAANVIYVVCVPNVTSVHRLVQFLRLMEMEKLRDLPFRIVLNHHHAPGEGDVSPARLAKTIGRAVDYTIDDAHSLISTSHNQGLAAVNLKPSGRFARQLTNILSSELGSSIIRPAEQGWWKLGGS